MQQPTAYDCILAILPKQIFVYGTGSIYFT